jgi:capsular exopolysaccharide synthesis family protein
MLLYAQPQTNGKPHDDAPLRSLANFLQRNRLLIAGLALPVVLATFLFLRLARPVYESAASLRVDQERSNVAVLDALSTLSTGSQIDSEMEELRSRTLAEEVVDSLDLQLAVDAPMDVPRRDLLAGLAVLRSAPEMEISLRRAGDAYELRVDDDDAPARTIGIGEPVELRGVRFQLAPDAAAHDEIRLDVASFQDAVRDFAERTSVARPNRDADFVVLRHEGPDSVLVRAVPNTMARLFIANRNGVRKRESLSTVAFLREQLDTLTGQLRTAENRLQSFREGEQIVAPQIEAEAQVQNMADLRAQRDLLAIDRDGLRQLLTQVAADPEAAAGEASPYRRLAAYPTLLRNPATSELLGTLAQVENDRAELLMLRTLEDPDVQVLSRRIRQIEEQLGSIAMTYLGSLGDQIAAYDATLRGFGAELARVPQKQIQFARHLREAELLEEIATLLQTRLKEAQIVAAIDDSSVRVVDPAIAPDEPIWPKRMLSLLLSVLVGLSLGVGVAFAREHMDTSIRSRDELQQVTGGVPVLGTIPRIAQVAGGNGKGRRGPVHARGAAHHPALQSRLIAGRDPRNPATEAYRSLRTNIVFSRPERAPKTLVFTSPTPGDGKSTSAANLAVTLAQQDLRVLLVDADMRRGVLHEVFGTPREPGLSNVLLGTDRVEDARHPIELAKGVVVDVLAMGTMPPNPAELLASERMEKLVQRLEEMYDAILFDAPPLTAVTDAALLGRHADGVIVVARQGVTERGAVRYAIDQLNAVRAPILGVVLNDIDVRKDRYYGGYGAASYRYYAAADR